MKKKLTKTEFELRMWAISEAINLDRHPHVRIINKDEWDTWIKKTSQELIDIATSDWAMPSKP